MPRREAEASDSIAEAIEPAPVARSDPATLPATGLQPPVSPAPCAIESGESTEADSVPGGQRPEFTI